jgi:hypothetical protein
MKSEKTQGFLEEREMGRTIIWKKWQQLYLLTPKAHNCYSIKMRNYFAVIWRAYQTKLLSYPPNLAKSQSHSDLKWDWNSSIDQWTLGNLHISSSTYQSLWKIWLQISINHKSNIIRESSSSWMKILGIIICFMIPGN